MIIEIAIILVALLLFDYLIKMKRNDTTSKLNGPPMYPIFGSAISMMSRNSNNILEYDSEARKKFGELYKVWYFNRLVIFCSNAKYIETILSSTKYIQKGPFYNLLRIWLGDSLLLSSGAKWHSRRKIITPTFHFKILEQFVEVFDQQSAVLVKKLKSHSENGDVLNIQPYIGLETLDIITETAMGTKINAQTDSENEYLKAVAELLLIISERFTNVWTRFEIFFTIFCWDKKKRQNKAIKVLHNFTEDIIEKRRKSLNELITSGVQKSLDNIDDVFGRKTRMALLDVLLQSTHNGKPLTNEDIREEVDTFVFEGHDTTTSAICSALFCISRDSTIQKRAFEEIRQVLGDDKERKISLKELQDLKYLELIIKETLRMYPPVPLFGRRLEDEVYFGDGQYLPAGIIFQLNIYAMQRDEILFPDPNKFNPDRYLDESQAKTNPFGYIPFSAGPRNCIGQKFAMLEMKSTLSKILRHYELLPLGPQMKIVVNTILKSANGVHLGLAPRVY